MEIEASVEVKVRCKVHQVDLDGEVRHYKGIQLVEVEQCADCLEQGKENND